jgi:conjugative transfer pilus assembly protein TraH
VYPANLQLPKVTAGCGGIDMFTGSFSFINSDQFVAMAKAVANNAIGFAFHLAIQAISPQIDKVMGDLEKAVQDLNQFNISSCEAASALVGGIAGEMGVKSNSVQRRRHVEGHLLGLGAQPPGCGNGGQQTSTNNQADGALKQQLPGRRTTPGQSSRPRPGRPEPADARADDDVDRHDRGAGARQRQRGATVQYVGPQVGPVLDALLDGTQSVNILKCTDSTDCLSLQTGARPWRRWERGAAPARQGADPVDERQDRDRYR